MDMIKDINEEINQINNKELKEKILDSALALLINTKELKFEDMPGIEAKFGYLLMIDNHGLEALFKIIKDGKVFYFACQQDTLRLININEEQFQSITEHMLDLHVNNKRL